MISLIETVWLAFLVKPVIKRARKDSFADENTQPHRSLRQLMDQENSSWQTPDRGLIRAAETNDSDIDSGDIANLEANTSDEDESSFFNYSFFDYEAVEEEEPKPF